MNALTENICRLHTTPLGAERIRKNLSLDEEDVVAWCRKRIADENTVLERRGKNWYARTPHCEITINAHSYTIITAHKL